MAVIKRAYWYITKKISKTLLIGIILFVVSSLILTGFLIQTAAQSAADNARKQLGSSVTYQADMSSAITKSDSTSSTSTKGPGRIEIPADYTALTSKEVETIASKSKYVDSYSITLNMMFSASNFAYYNPNSTDSSSTTTVAEDRGPSQSKVKADTLAVGVGTKQSNTLFNDGTNTIVDGSYFTDEQINSGENVILIEETIANINRLKVGDTINLKKSDNRMFMKFNGSNTLPGSTTSTEDVIITYKIQGIYKTANKTQVDTNVGGYTSTYSLAENTMYMPYSTVYNASLIGLSDTDKATAVAKEASDGYEISQATFILDDTKNIDAFKAEVAAMDGINHTYRSLSANDTLYQTMVKPIQNVASTSGLLVIVVTIAGIAIIALISMLSVKDRKYEIGVLLSLGESKIKVMMQLLMEMTVIAVIAFTLSVFTSSFVAQGVTNYLLNQEVASAKTAQTAETNNGPGMGNIRNRAQMFTQSNTSSIDAKTIESLSVSLNMEDAMKVFGMGLLIVILGNTVQAIFVLRFNPKQILQDR